MERDLQNHSEATSRDDANLTGEDIFRRLEGLAAQRSPWEKLWQNLAEYVLPKEAGFVGQQGDIYKGGRIFDSTAPLALERFAAVLEAVLTPRGRRWHNLKTGVGTLDEHPEVKQYLEAVTDILFKARYRADSGFANQISEAYLSLGVFGTAVFFIDYQPGEGLIYRNRHLSEIYFGENSRGVIDTVIRQYKLTARQAVAEFDPENLPLSITKAAADGKIADKKFDFLHAVMPNDNRCGNRADFKGMPFKSYHLAREGQTIVREGGYRVLPYAVSRFQTAPGELYGRGPALTVFADIKQVNEMEKTLIRAGQKTVDPPLLLTDDDVLSSFSLKAGALNYGGLSDDGRQRVVPLQSGANLALGFQMLDQKRQVINDAFLVNFFQILAQTPQMSATEVLARAQEKGALLGPIVGRQQAELLAPVIKRELDILISLGHIPPLPAILEELNGEVLVQYESPLIQNQRHEDSLAITRTINTLMPLVGLKPEILEIFKAQDMARLVAAANGVPARIIYNQTELERRRQTPLSDQILPKTLVNQLQAAINNSVLPLASRDNK